MDIFTYVLTTNPVCFHRKIKGPSVTQICNLIPKKNMGGVGLVTALFTPLICTSWQAPRSTFRRSKTLISMDYRNEVGRLTGSGSLLKVNPKLPILRSPSQTVSSPQKKIKQIVPDTKLWWEFENWKIEKWKREMCSRDSLYCKSSTTLRRSNLQESALTLCHHYLISFFRIYHNWVDLLRIYFSNFSTLIVRRGVTKG